MIRISLLLLLGVGPSVVWAEDLLESLHATLIGMRGQALGSLGPRGASPQLTVAKHQLRDWVDSRLTALPMRGDESELEERLNAELHQASLSCDDYRAPQPERCPEQTNLGFVGNLNLRRSAAFVIVQTRVGIECGYDESVYLYGWSKEGWRRVWQNEQNTYTEKEYKPQTLNAIRISSYSKSNDYVALTLGSESWCASNWHQVYYRAFRLGPDPEAAPILEGSDVAYFGGDRTIQGSVTTEDVLVEVTIRSIDSGVSNRPAVRHYKIDHGRVRRVAPLALSPRDFVDEWLTHDWKEAAFWSESANRRSTREWHSKLPKDGDFIYPTMHCPEMPDLWQVGVDFSNPPTPLDAAPKGTFFVVRWRPPYDFTMVRVSNQPQPGCTKEDRNADDENRTLFPVQ